MKEIKKILEDLSTLNEAMKIFTFPEYEQANWELVNRTPAPIYNYKKGKLEYKVKEPYATLPASAKSPRTK